MNSIGESWKSSNKTTAWRIKKNYSTVTRLFVYSLLWRWKKSLATKLSFYCVNIFDQLICVKGIFIWYPNILFMLVSFSTILIRGISFSLNYLLQVLNKILYVSAGVLILLSITVHPNQVYCKNMNSLSPPPTTWFLKN